MTQLQMAQQSTSQQSTSQQQTSRHQTGQQFPQQQMIVAAAEVTAAVDAHSEIDQLVYIYSISLSSSQFLMFHSWIHFFFALIFYHNTYSLNNYFGLLIVWIYKLIISSSNELNIFEFIPSFNQWIFMNLFLPPMNIHEFIPSFNQWIFMNLFLPPMNIHEFIFSFNQWIFMNLFLPPMNIHEFIPSFNQWIFINLFLPPMNIY